jgi:hypothetical protein
MGFAKFERSFLAMMERTALGVVRPLTTTRDLASYANRGYVVAGVLLAGLCLALYGYLNQPIYEAPRWIINIYNFTIGKIPWWPWRESTNSLLQFPLVLYVAGGVLSKVRQPIGKWVLDAVLAFMNFAIALGEWCLENPWKSVLLAMALLSVFVLSLSRSITFATERQVVTHDLDYWFDSAEKLVNHNTMTGPEDEQYGAVHERWRPEFGKLLQEKSKHHSAQCLMQSMDALYSKLPVGEESWPDTLTLRLPALQNAATACDEAHESVHDPYIDRAFALSHLFLGRAYARLSETPADQVGAVQIHYSRLALEQFLIVEKELHGHMAGGDLRYLGEAMNGKGTVYANALTVALQHSQKLSGKGLEELQSICVTSYDCVLQGFNAYQESSKTLLGVALSRSGC